MLSYRQQSEHVTSTFSTPAQHLGIHNMQSQTEQYCITQCSGGHDARTKPRCQVAPTQGDARQAKGKDGDGSCCLDRSSRRGARQDPSSNGVHVETYTSRGAQNCYSTPPASTTPDSGRHTRRAKSPQHTMVQRCNCSSNRPQQKTAEAVSKNQAVAQA